MEGGEFEQSAATGRMEQSVIDLEKDESAMEYGSPMRSTEPDLDMRNHVPGWLKSGVIAADDLAGQPPATSPSYRRDDYR